METHSVHLIHDIGLAIIAAAILAHIARLIKQPLMLGYIAGGALLGPNLGFALIESEESIELIAEMGLIMLLFIIGLEIRLPEILKMGKELFLLGVLQFGGGVLAGLALFRGLGIGGGGQYDVLYLSVAAALSSTLIVVKLLQEKFELKTNAGKLTLGILVLQDLWAILFMGLQPNLSDPRVDTILQSVLGVVGLSLASFLLSRFVLSRIFAVAARSPELLLLTATGWCFAVCGFAEWAGLSLEMGALVAGLSIAAFPYGHDVIVKLGGVRDFFITLFFVALGMKVPAPQWSVIQIALLLLVFVYLSRLLTITPIAWLTGKGLRAGAVTALNLSQVSEFSLVILALGAGYGHVSKFASEVVLTAMLIASLTSTYTILFNDTLGRGVVRFFGLFGMRDREGQAIAAAGVEHHRDIIILGYFRIAQGLLGRLEKEAPHLIQRILIVDFNPEHRAALEAKGYAWTYGDLAQPESLEHHGIGQASMILVTVSDVFLKGTSNARLLGQLQSLAPEARIVVTVDDPTEGDALLERGAAYSIVPGRLAGTVLFDHVKEMAGGH